jgi:hypothetical protein
MVEVAAQGREAVRAQLSLAVGRGRQRQQAHMGPQQPRDTQPDIATADDEHTLTAKARRQGAKRILV